MALADGGFLVTWENDNADLVRAQRFDAVGHKIGVEFTVKIGVSVDSPEAALLTDGRIAFAVGDVSTGDADVDDLDLGSAHARAELRRHQPDRFPLAAQQRSGRGLAAQRDELRVRRAGRAQPRPELASQGDGDFNKDGRSDFLWQNDNGQAAVWLMNGTSLIGGGPVGRNPGPSWHVIDSGDFNGDGNDDFLWQDNSGQAAVWLMNGTSLVGGGPVGNPGADWHVKASGDFNGDLRSDILWQNDSGQAAVWLMNGTSLVGGGPVGQNPGPSWHVIDAGDFNGDHWSDILWQNDSGQAADLADERDEPDRRRPRREPRRRLARGGGR